MSSTYPQHIEKVLSNNLNFSEKETLVYLALLELGSSKPTDVAKKTDLNRTTVYDICDSLRKKGIVSSYKKKSNTFFTALEPNRLIDYLEREKEDNIQQIEHHKDKVQALLPELISLQDISSTKPKVKFFEGEKGIREAYEDTLTCKDKILAYANIETTNKSVPGFFPEYYKRRAKKGIPIYAILTDNEASRQRAALDTKELRQSKFWPKKDETYTPEVNIYNNKIMIVSLKEKMAIIIESKELADLQKLIFNLVWDKI